jgi:hypothetical protein
VTWEAAVVGIAMIGIAKTIAPVIGVIEGVIIVIHQHVLAYFPQHQFIDIQYGIAIAEFVYLPRFDVADGPGYGDLPALGENFGIIETGLAGNEPA